MHIQKWMRNRLRRLLPIVAALSLLLGGVVATEVVKAPSAHASTGNYPWSDATYVDANYDWGYSTCPSNDTGCMLFTGYNSGVKYGEADPWGYYLRNCTSFVAWKLTSQGVSAGLVKGLGNGGDWYNNAPASERSTTPAAGDAAVVPGTTAKPYGHVAYIDAVNSDGTITIEEYNHAGDGTWDTRTGTASSLGFTEFVNFALQVGGTPSPSASPPPPPDTDGDGIPDSQDVCVDTPGVAYLSGCPQQLAKLNGDFNGDGKADVAAFYEYPERGNAVGLFIWPGNGDGTFGAPQLAWYTSTGWDGTHMITAGAGDFNHDGYADIAVIYRYDDNSVKLFTWSGNASLTFADPVVQATETAWSGANTIPVGVGDFNGDGKQDIATFYRYPERGNALGLFIWPGNGDGTFGAPQLAWYASTGWDGLHVIVAGVGDFNHDGYADIAAFYEYPGTVTRLFTWSGNASLTFADPAIRDTESGWEGFHTVPIGVGDFNGDGNLDIAVFYRYPERGNAVGLFIWYGNGDGTFPGPQLPWYTSTGWDGLHVIPAGVGDYDQNGQSDITSFYEYPGTVTRMFEWHDEHWGSFPSSDPTVQFYGTGWEGFHILA